jgi:hypothetical protein
MGRLLGVGILRLALKPKKKITSKKGQKSSNEKNNKNDAFLKFQTNLIQE